MKLLRFCFLSIPFIVFPLASYVSAWFLFAEGIYVWISSLASYLIFIYFYWNRSTSFSIGESKDRNITLLFIFLFIILFLLFPVRNLNLGDGIILVENVFLESGLFGYQLTLDELLEAILHSWFYNYFSVQVSDPRVVYRILSTLAGIILLIVLFVFSRIKKIQFFSMAIIFSSGGMLLFFGYSENYSYATLFILIFLIASIQLIGGNKKNLNLLILPTILASIAILFHLVSGYLIFPLVYLWYIGSEKGKYFQNAILSFLIGCVIILPFFIYFIFFSETRADLSQTHIAHPPFYPISRMVSTKHLSEIFACIFFTCFASFFILLDLFLFGKEKLTKLKKDKEFIFLSFSVLGFFIHAFIFNPLLGFPADWDIMSFYWIALAMLGVYISNSDERSKKIMFPLSILSFLILTGNIFYLSKPVESKEKELLSTLNLADQFLTQEKDRIRKMDPKIKKFYFKTDFFLFKAESNLRKFENTKLLSEAKNYREELRKNSTEFNLQWQKDYIRRLTEFHHAYLQLIKN